jgi:hypothetical protein
MTPERAAPTLNSGGGLRELIRSFARVSALRTADESTALQVV